MNPILALHIANPQELKNIVGFKVETFYTSGTNGNLIYFWEALEDGWIGKTKQLSREKTEKRCLEAMRKLRREVT